MGMVLRLTDEETERLRKRAEAEHRSMHEVVRVALEAYLDTQDDDTRTRVLAREEVARWANVLRRLGE
jgi:predicted transcriptional regulator